MNIWTATARDAGKLSVFNGTIGQWTHAADMAIDLFNTMAKHYKIGISMGAEKDEDAANIVVKVAGGTESYTFSNQQVNLTVPQGVVHGKTHTFSVEKGPIEKAIIFVPASTQTQAGFIHGKTQYQDLSAEGRAGLIVHEFIHAAGLDDNKDHDMVGGLFYPSLQIVNGKLRESSSDKSPLMPPVRLEGASLGQLKQLWSK